MEKINVTGSGTSEQEKNNRNSLFELFKNCPIPNDEVLQNLPLFLKRQDLTRILFINDIYQKILEVNGVVMEFGVRWGHNLALFTSLRGVYEPFNHSRKIIGFDTFEGFDSIDQKDGSHEIIEKGSFGVSKGYEKYLGEVMTCLENESPIPHIKKHSLIKGNAISQIDSYLNNHPETIISLAYFDFDIYKPTKHCLERISKHITKGTILAFDELNHHVFPGETLAFQEVLGINNYAIRRSKFSNYQSYIIID
jgi:hypothetical protein